MELDPQTLAADTAKEAVTVLRDQPNTPLAYTAYGLLDAFIRLVKHTDQDLDPRLLEYRKALVEIIEGD